MKRLFTGLVPFLFAFALLIGTALFLAPAAMANGVTPPDHESQPADPEPAKALAAASADLCKVPTSLPPAGYAPDAKTWPCRNFSK